jgi:hypothetical protein
MLVAGGGGAHGIAQLDAARVLLVGKHFAAGEEQRKHQPSSQVKYNNPIARMHGRRLARTSESVKPGTGQSVQQGI